MQLVDELSMIYTTCLMCWATFSYGRSLTTSTLLGAALVLLAGSITFIYHHLQDPVFHQTAYAILTAVVLFRSWYLMESRLRKPDPQSVRTMWSMTRYGLTFFLGGFAVWNLDNAYCGELRRWRRSVGLPWGVLAEGHGWWHLLTGWGAYYYIIYGA
jgi:dihydroceramidase